MGTRPARPIVAAANARWGRHRCRPHFHRRVGTERCLRQACRAPLGAVPYRPALAPEPDRLWLVLAARAGSMPSANPNRMRLVRKKTGAAGRRADHFVTGLRPALALIGRSFGFPPVPPERKPGRVPYASRAIPPVSGFVPPSSLPWGLSGFGIPSSSTDWRLRPCSESHKGQRGSLIHFRG